MNFCIWLEPGFNWIYANSFEVRTPKLGFIILRSILIILSDKRDSMRVFLVHWFQFFYSTFMKNNFHAALSVLRWIIYVHTRLTFISQTQTNYYFFYRIYIIGVQLWCWNWSSNKYNEFLFKRHNLDSNVWDCWHVKQSEWHIFSLYLFNSLAIWCVSSVLSVVETEKFTLKSDWWVNDECEKGTPYISFLTWRWLSKKPAVMIGHN